MARQKKILLDNALVSWASAIRYCKLILRGKVTLEVRKNFVAVLQNAVELFLKQIMLDNCDYRVATPRKINAEGEPAKSYYCATDLNAYFENLSSKQRQSFYSAEFSKLTEWHKDILKVFLQEGSYKDALILLGKLRNNETHFYIDKQEYLTETEFITLHDFMVDFYDVLQEYSLLPFDGVATSEHDRLTFNHPYIKTFSYAMVVKSAPIVQQMASVADGMKFQDIFPLTSFEIAECIATRMENLSDDRFNEIWAYAEVLEQFGMIDVVQTDMYEGDDYTTTGDYDEPVRATHFDFELQFYL